MYMHGSINSREQQLNLWKYIVKIHSNRILVIQQNNQCTQNNVHPRKKKMWWLILSGIKFLDSVIIRQTVQLWER